MEIEKAFAIHGEPADIWQTLWADLTNGQPDQYEIVTSTWPSTFTLRIELAGIPSLLTYRITPREDDNEVSAALEPLGLKYRLYQLLTFGHMRRNFEVMLVQGLVNLKDAVEGTGYELVEDGAEEDEAEATGP